MFATTTVGSLPRPDRLAEPGRLRAAWRLAGNELQRGTERSALECALGVGADLARRRLAAGASR